MNPDHHDQFWDEMCAAEVQTGVPMRFVLDCSGVGLQGTVIDAHNGIITLGNGSRIRWEKVLWVEDLA